MSVHLLSTCIIAAHWLVVAGLSVRVILRRPPVGVALAWIAVVSSAPFLGAAAYLLFGERRLGRQRAARTAKGFGDLQQWLAEVRQRCSTAPIQLSASADPLRRHAENVLGFPALTGNTIELLDDSGRVFDAIVADIEAATVTCDACFYIWHEAGRAADVVNALERAARRGVRCRALADAVGSKAFLRSASARRLRQAGVDLRAALPTGPLQALFVRRDLRNHRKIVVLDSRVAYVGSQNLVDPRFFKQTSGVGQWVDAMVRIAGPVAAALEAVFGVDWSAETGLPSASRNAVGEQAGASAGTAAQVVPSGPAPRPEALHQLLLTAIYAAREELVLTTPYFVPDELILTALLSAALRGVKVVLVVPARNDSLLVRQASVAHFDDLMAAGVSIALFRGGLLHTKSMTIDGSTSFLGSVNLDMRSVWLNFEISLLVYDTGFTRQLVSLQQRYLANSERLDPGVWRQRAAWRRLTEDAFRLLAPLL